VEGRRAAEGLGRPLRHRTGGIGGLAGLVREHGGAIEADLQAHYGVALSGLTTGELTWRRLKVLLTYLPPDSATARSIRGADHEPEWTRTEHLLAGVFDALNMLLWQNAVLSGVKPKPRKPEPLMRPGVTPRTITYGRPAPLSHVRALLASSAPGTAPDDAEEG
jgi:hypothetical protein